MVVDETLTALVKYSDGFYETLSHGLDLLEGFGKLDNPVLIKPNICTVKDDTGYSVTDVKLVQDLTQLLLEAGAPSVKIVESDSQSKNAMEAFRKFGYDKIVEDFRVEGHDVSLVDLSKEPLADIDIEGRYFETEIKLHPVLAEPHHLISLAVAKTHYLTFITGALKNLFGLLPRKDKSFYHPHIDDVILDLLGLVQPNLSIIDARVGVEGWNGPKTKEIGAFIMSKSPVSADAVLTRIIGFGPLHASHLILCANHGYESLNPKIVYHSLDDFTVQLKEP
jgi:uncharacterized protein (DUF362 family)